LKPVPGKPSNSDSDGGTECPYRQILRTPVELELDRFEDPVVFPSSLILSWDLDLSLKIERLLDDE
jgi:hypothetical protein